jgi:hypothetical protein
MMVRWLYSDDDERAHALDENNTTRFGTVVTICRQVLPDTAPVYQTAPSINICPRCGSYAAVPPPEHTTSPESISPSPCQDPGRSPVLSTPEPSPAPGDRPVPPHANPAETTIFAQESQHG